MSLLIDHFHKKRIFNLISCLIVWWIACLAFNPLAFAQESRLNVSIEVLDRALVTPDNIDKHLYSRGGMVWLGNIGTVNDGDDWRELIFNYGEVPTQAECCFLNENTVLAYIDNSIGDKNNIGLWRSLDGGITWVQVMGIEFNVYKIIQLKDGSAIISGMNTITKTPFLTWVDETRIDTIPLPTMDNGSIPMIVSGEALDNGYGWVIGSWTAQIGGKEIYKMFPINTTPFQINWKDGTDTPEFRSTHGTYLSVSLLDGVSAILYERCGLRFPYNSSIWISQDGCKSWIELEKPGIDMNLKVTKCFWLDPKQVVFVNLGYALGGGDGALWIYNTDTHQWRFPGEIEVNGWNTLESVATSRNAAKVLLAVSMLSSEGHIDYNTITPLPLVNKNITKKQHVQKSKNSKTRKVKERMNPHKNLKLVNPKNIK